MAAPSPDQRMVRLQRGDEVRWVPIDQLRDPAFRVPDEQAESALAAFQEFRRSFMVETNGEGVPSDALEEILASLHDDD